MACSGVKDPSSMTARARALYELGSASIPALSILTITFQHSWTSPFKASSSITAVYGAGPIIPFVSTSSSISIAVSKLPFSASSRTSTAKVLASRSTSRRSISDKTCSTPFLVSWRSRTALNTFAVIGIPFSKSFSASSDGLGQLATADAKSRCEGIAPLLSIISVAALTARSRSPVRLVPSSNPRNAMAQSRVKGGRSSCQTRLSIQGSLLPACCINDPISSKSKGLFDVYCLASAKALPSWPHSAIATINALATKGLSGRISCNRLALISS
mmetsp:Transcript_4435/g.18918  ORF Transcript_4435/g.18918 Transcript_4435/m.18918 type:complete len:273 (-) Transcript_4435:2072-2890(-)